MAKIKKNNSINLIDLDHQGLVNSFKSYLKNQEEFKDYDFNSSSLNVLLDILGMNTFKNMFYLNMAFSERFLDSAQLRSSLFSRAKELNYLPRSKRSAIAKIKVTFSATGDSQPYVIKKGSQFSTLIKSKSYTFTIPQTLTISSVNNDFSFETDIYEGIFLKESFIFKEENNLSRFKISNENIDTRSLNVTVFEDGSEVGDIYNLSNSLLGLNKNSKVFFLQTSETGKYEIYFGDNVVGYQPKNNSLIILDYRITEGVDGNGAKTFSVDFDPTSKNELLSTPELEVIEASKNGEEEETNESIKYYAPRQFQTQERAVVVTDYEILLKNQFPEINSITVFGGENLNPPQFSKVFVSVDIKEIDGLPDSKKQEYFNFLRKRSMFPTIPEFIEPEQIFISLNCLIKYNLNITENNNNRIKNIVESIIDTYNKEKLNDFNVTFRTSELIKLITTEESSIISINLIPEIYKKINPELNKNQNFTINFDFSLLNNLAKQNDVYPISDKTAVKSSEFIFNGSTATIEDDSDGRLRIISTENNLKRKIVDIGSVNYDTGVVKIENLNVSSYFGNGIKILVSPDDIDVVCKNNNIMSILPEDVRTQIIQISE